jgi:hypothetical protein
MLLLLLLLLLTGVDGDALATVGLVVLEDDVVERLAV